ncbi:lipoate--protein ligase family protein [bacterium]|nr:lipoate--protein ligase family protein [bacterium]
MIKYIPFAVYDGKKNMDIDAQLLEDAISSHQEDAVFRLYGWNPPCISLGRNQDDNFLDKDFLKKNNIDVVRRLTGGRALLHDNEITYSFICPVEYLENGEHIVSSYKEISQILIDKFKKLGIELDFGTAKPVKTGFDYCMLISTGADLCYKNKKLIGSAQCRKNGYILQHGSILYDYDKELLEKIFGEKVDPSEITTIKEINPDISKEDIIKILS